MTGAQRTRVLQLTFPAQPQIIHQIRNRFEEFIRPSGLSTEDVEAIKVALSEACSNAVCHGSPGGRNDHIRLRCQVEMDCLTIEVSDDGGGFAPANFDLPNSDEWKPSGRGLFLMRALMDDVQFTATAEGTRVRLVKSLGPSPAPGTAPAGLPASH